MRIAPWTVAGSLAMGCASAAGQDRYRTENVVIAVMDGTAWIATFGDPEHRYIPRLWNELRPQGTLYTRFYNDDVTITKAGHSTIATGTWQKTRNRGPRSTRPTLFDYLHDEQESYTMSRSRSRSASKAESLPAVVRLTPRGFLADRFSLSFRTRA